MKKNYKLTILIILLLTINIIFLTSCERKKHIIEKDKTEKQEPTKRYSEITLMKVTEENSIEEYSLTEEKKAKLDTISLLSDFKYSIKNNVYIYRFIKNKGSYLNNNYIKILYNNRWKVLEDFYSATDLNLSKGGSKISFRAFRNDDFSSVEDKVRIYDIKENKYLDLKTNTLISGNLFTWSSENSLIYYGVKELNGSMKASLFQYDFIKEEEKEIFSQAGNIMFLKMLNQGEILFLLRGVQGDELYRLNLENKQYIKIPSSLETIYKAIESKGSTIFLAKDKYNNLSIYELDNTNKLKRKVYDFPSIINENSGIAMDVNGNVFFIGTQGNKSGIYMINPATNTITLLWEEEGEFHIFGEES